MSKIPGIIVSATRWFTGKTAFCLGLALNMQNQGYKVGFFKPIVHVESGFIHDTDVLTFRKMLNLKEPYEVIAPIQLGPNFLEGYINADLNGLKKLVLNAYEKICEGKDFIIIEGLHTYNTGCLINLSAPLLSKMFDLKTLLLSKIESDFSIDDIILANNYIKSEGKFLGVILNRIPRLLYKRTKEIIVPELEKRGIKVFGLIPENKTLMARTAREIHESLGGEVLVCEECLDNLVEEVLIGAMTYESALKYFMRVPNKAVVTGGDRADIALAALQTDTSLLIFTGNLYPSQKVLNEAESKKVPVILVPTDTYTTIKNLERVTGRIGPEDKRRAELAKEVVDKYVDWKSLIEESGLKK
jgi:BioD-like phosphotransacetylase family protein